MKGFVVPLVPIAIERTKHLLSRKLSGESVAQPFQKRLWSHLESNQAPTDYESVALTE